MKKILATIVLLAYFMVSTGFIVCVHYCMDRFDSAQLGAAEDEECGKCGMHKGENNCCRDEVKVVKMTTDHLAFSIAQLSAPAALPPERFPTLFDLPLRNAAATAHPRAHAPPLPNEDLYRRYGVFRI